MQTIIDIPQFLPPTKTSDNSAAGNSIPRTPAAVFIPAPGMALTHATESEPLDLPAFLNSAARQTQHASDGDAFRTTGHAVTRGCVAEPSEERGETDKTDFQHSQPS